MGETGPRNPYQQPLDIESSPPPTKKPHRRLALLGKLKKPSAVADAKSPVPPTKEKPPDKDEAFKKYEKQLRLAKRAALITTGFYSFNWFLGFCALTWASAVILGGLLSELSKADFYSVSVLLMLEALRLGGAIFFGNFVTHKLVYLSADPTNLQKNNSSEFRRHTIVEAARVLDQAVQLVVISVSILVPFRRLQELERRHENVEFDAHKHSLMIFYIGVLINALVAAVAVVYAKTLVLLLVKTPSLRRYYEEIVWRGLDAGFLHATEFDLWSFAFKIQSEEYSRNLRPLLVEARYSDLIEFLYAHPQYKGFEAATIALGSEDCYVRQAAANVVGFWAALDRKYEPSVCLQRRLLAELAAALDHDETGRAASSSFEQLAKLNPRSTLAVEGLLKVLMERVAEAVDAGKPDKALVFIKVLIPMLEAVNQGRENTPARTVPDLSELRESLELTFEKHPGCLKRTLAVAGKALTLLYGGRELSEAQKGALRQSTEKKQQHVLEDEAAYVRELLPGEWGDKKLPEEWGEMEVRPPPPKEEGHGAGYPSRAPSFLAAVVTVALFVIVSTVVFQYTSF